MDKQIVKLAPSILAADFGGNRLARLSKQKRTGSVTFPQE
jgi:hypothetical protein